MLTRALIAVLFAAFCARADIHQIHKQKLGSLTCSLCHQPTERGSVMLKPPSVEQCRVCHGVGFQMPPALAPSRTVLRDFSHAHHIDSKARIDPASGVRADCAFCHTSRASVPTHEQCATCHSKPGIRPRLTDSIATTECLGCHAPGEAATENRHLASYSNIRFSHADHRANCASCHAAVLSSDHFANIALPAMADCMSCHKPTNCSTCHVDAISSTVRPPFHTEDFRRNHASQAAAADAKCFACHQNVRPAANAHTAKMNDQCSECHQVMKPVSHTARWKDDIHGEYAAIDRTSCSACHVADYCARCHNELPRSHQPLPLFKAGGHARLAMLNQRACMTCHTFTNLCAECHARR